LERNTDFHHDAEGDLELHSKQVFSMHYMEDWGGGIGFYWESKRYPMFYGEPSDKRSSGVLVIIPITRLFMESRFYSQVANKIKIFGSPVGIGEPWSWWVPSLEIGYQSKVLGLFLKFGREFNCNSGSLGFNIKL